MKIQRKTGALQHRCWREYARTAWERIKELLPAAACELCGVPKSVRSESTRLSLLRVVSLGANDGLIAEHLRKQSFGTI